MDGIEKLSRLSLVACDQSYDALVAKGVSKLAPYLDSGAGDIAPNTMPASFYDPVYVGLNDWTGEIGDRPRFYLLYEYRLTGVRRCPAAPA